MASVAGILVAVVALVAPQQALADQLSDKRAQARALAAKLAANGDRISQLAEDLDAATISVASLQTKQEAATRDLARIETATASARGALRDQALTVYARSGVDVGAGGPSGRHSTDKLDGLLRHEYTQSLQAKQVGALDKMRAQLLELRDARAAVQAATARAAAALQSVKTAQAAAEKASTEQEATLAQVKGDLADLVAQEQTRQAADDARKVQEQLAKRTLKINQVPADTADPTPGGPAKKTNKAAPVLNLGPPPASAPGAASAVAEARRQIGKPYSWGAAGPGSFDCSGLTMWAWRAGGKSLPHSSRAQYSSTTHVSAADVQIGDLMFFGNPIHHVGLYSGGGNMVDAPHSGAYVREVPAFRSDLVGIGRP